MYVNILYLLAFLIPLVLIPMVLPAFVLMAHRKRLTDGPGPRKRQSYPVALMGGTVMMLVICITTVIINLFFDLSPLFPVLCVMFMLYIFGLMDDAIGLLWMNKLLLQAVAVLLLYFGSKYGVHDFYAIPFLRNMSPWLSCLLTLFFGLLLLNAVNFSDGIDGLASALGVLAGLTMGYWHTRHGFVTQAVLCYIMVGVMTGFFFFNVFSKRYKSYMGDSGSLVLGLFIFIAVCDDNFSTLDGSFLADNYSLSFIISVLSVMLFDLVRVVLTRVFYHKAPYKGDRSHLHHVFVDMGMNHLMATTLLVLINLVVVAVWYLTANIGMHVLPQLFIVVATGILCIWTPYFLIVYCRDKRPSVYSHFSSRCNRISLRVDRIVDIGQNIIDRRSKKNKASGQYSASLHSKQSKEYNNNETIHT